MNSIQIQRNPIRQSTTTSATCVRTSRSAFSTKGITMRKLFSKGIAAGLAVLALAGGAQAVAAPDAAWLDDDLSVRKEIVLKPGAGGAGLDAKVATFPFALRLSTQTLAFEDVQPDGSDLRVAGHDGQRVDHYVEN